MSITLEPIGVFHCDARHPYDAPRQPGLSEGECGRIELHPSHNFEQALLHLDGFSHVWLIYLFDRNENWKPMVQPPRADHKVGVFASRAPYRPNPIGLSCVQLHGVKGLHIDVGPHDLLDGTPILDIKPYLPYADSIPDASAGWLENIEAQRWNVTFTNQADAQLAWLAAHALTALRPFLLQQLSERPDDQERKRVRPLEQGTWEIAYRTWRAQFMIDERNATVVVEEIYTGYSKKELTASEDSYQDKALHRAYLDAFPQEAG